MPGPVHTQCRVVNQCNIFHFHHPVSVENANLIFPQFFHFANLTSLFLKITFFWHVVSPHCISAQISLRRLVYVSFNGYFYRETRPGFNSVSTKWDLSIGSATFLTPIFRLHFFLPFSELEFSTLDYKFSIFFSSIEIQSIIDNYLFGSFSAQNYRFFFNSYPNTIELSTVPPMVTHY